MIKVDNFDLMMISLAIGKLSPRGARTLFESWIQTSMETYILKHDIHLPVAQLFWPEAAEDESLVYDGSAGGFGVKIPLYLWKKNNDAKFLGGFEAGFFSSIWTVLRIPSSWLQLKL